MKKHKVSIYLFMIYVITFAQEPQAVPILEEQADLESVEKVVQVQDDYLKESPPYIQRELDPSFKDNYKGNIFDYDRIVEEEEPEEVIIEDSNELPSFNFPVQIIEPTVYILIGAILLLITYLILRNSEVGFFSKPKTKIIGITEETDENLENIQLNNFQKLIAEAKRNGDFRKAVRYYYLWLLQKLSDKKQIQWHRDKTDNEYLLELSSNKIFDEFSNLLYLYDYVWFGKYPLSKSDFEQGESFFKTTLNKI